MVIEMKTGLYLLHIPDYRCSGFWGFRNTGENVESYSWDWKYQKLLLTSAIGNVVTEVVSEVLDIPKCQSKATARTSKLFWSVPNSDYHTRKEYYLLVFAARDTVINIRYWPNDAIICDWFRNLNNKKNTVEKVKLNRAKLVSRPRLRSYNCRLARFRLLSTIEKQFFTGNYNLIIVCHLPILTLLKVEYGARWIYCSWTVKDKGD